MQKTLPIWAALPLGAICGAAIGTIVASAYLTLALKMGFANFDMLTVWKASAGLRHAHPEAFKGPCCMDTPTADTESVCSI